MARGPPIGVRYLTDALCLLFVRFEMARWLTPYPDSHPPQSRTKRVSLKSKRHCPCRSRSYRQRREASGGWAEARCSVCSMLGCDPSLFDTILPVMLRVKVRKELSSRETRVRPRPGSFRINLVPSL